MHQPQILPDILPRINDAGHHQVLNLILIIMQKNSIRMPLSIVLETSTYLILTGQINNNPLISSPDQSTGI